MAVTPQRVLVTGVNGFLGSHVALHLLNAGYIVRGTVRRGKYAALRASLRAHYPSLELVIVDDIGSSDLSHALEGVDAVLHVASHVFGRLPAADILSSAIGGTLNVLSQSVNAGIGKVVLTGTAYAIFDPDYKATKVHRKRPFTSKDWGGVGYSQKEIIKGNFHPTWVYASSKILAEQAAWDFATRHPQLDLSVILPPYIYGPYAPYFPVTEKSLASNFPIYALLTGRQPPMLLPFFSDVRDVARAHVAALSLPPISSGQPLQHKRFLLTTGAFTWIDVLQYLKIQRPDLRGRITTTGLTEETVEVFDREGMMIDVERTNLILGLEDADGGLIGWKKCVRDTVNSLLEAERKWTEEANLQEGARARL